MGIRLSAAQNIDLPAQLLRSRAPAKSLNLPAGEEWKKLDVVWMESAKCGNDAVSIVNIVLSATSTRFRVFTLEDVRC